MKQVMVGVKPETRDRLLIMKIQMRKANKRIRSLDDAINTLIDRR